jgi:hypothetical protein
MLLYRSKLKLNFIYNGLHALEAMESSSYSIFSSLYYTNIYLANGYIFELWRHDLHWDDLPTDGWYNSIKTPTNTNAFISKNLNSACISLAVTLEEY